MTSWIKRNFSSASITQAPAGPHVAQLQNRLGGTVTRIAQMKAENILFVTRGLGSAAAHVFGRITDKDPESARAERVEDLAAGIADMATQVKARGGITRG